MMNIDMDDHNGGPEEDTTFEKITPKRLVKKIKDKKPLVELYSHELTITRPDFNIASFVLESNGYHVGFWLCVGFQTLQDFIHNLPDADYEQLIYKDKLSVLDFHGKPLFFLLDMPEIKNGLYLISDVSKRKIAFVKFDDEASEKKAYSEPGPTGPGRDATRQQYMGQEYQGQQPEIQQYQGFGSRSSSNIGTEDTTVRMEDGDRGAFDNIGNTSTGQEARDNLGEAEPEVGEDIPF